MSGVVTRRFADLVPAQVLLPCRYTSAVVSLHLVVEEDPVRVVAPTLDDVKGALAVGSAELVRSYCALWTRWLQAACAAATMHAPERREGAISPGLIETP